MSITTQQLADLVGVSRGTVDRVLNNRGRVSPEMRRRIEDAAQRYGYVPHAMGRALARAKNPVKIGVVLHLAALPVFHEVLAGVQRAGEELAKLGGIVLCETIPGLDAAAHVQAVEKLAAEGVQGLAITPVEDEALSALLNRLAAEGMEIVTLNSDAPDVKRRCFVGLDNVKSGHTAAGLFHLMLGRAGGKVLVINGTLANRINSQRVDGFLQILAQKHPEIEVVGIQFSQDDEARAAELVRQALEAHSDLAGIFMVSGGQAGACRALAEAGRADEVRLVVYDAVPETLRYIEEGVIDIIIDQNARQQGRLPPAILFDLLFAGKPPEAEEIYTDIRIKTQYNL